MRSRRRRDFLGNIGDQAIRMRRFVYRHYLAVAAVLGLAALLAWLLSHKGPLGFPASFALGVGTSVIAGALSERAHRLREREGRRLRLFGRNSLETGVKILYPDFIEPKFTDEQEHSVRPPTYQRNIDFEATPIRDELEFDPVNVYFERHVSKEDMDAVRAVNLLLDQLGVAGVYVQRDYSYLSRECGLPIEEPKERDVTSIEALVDWAKELGRLRHTTIGVALGSNLLTKIYAQTSGALLSLPDPRPDPEISAAQYREPFNTVATAGCIVLTDRFLETACPDKDSFTVADLSAHLRKEFGHAVRPIDVPGRRLSRRKSDVVASYTFRTRAGPQEEEIHFGLILRHPINRRLDRNLFIVGGSGPYGTRLAAEFLVGNGEQLQGELEYAKCGDAAFLAVVKAEKAEFPSSKNARIRTYVEEFAFSQRELVYLLARPSTS